MVHTLILSVPTIFMALLMMVLTSIPMDVAVDNLVLVATTLDASAKSVLVHYHVEPTLWVTCVLSRVWTTVTICTHPRPTTCADALDSWFTEEAVLATHLKDASWLKAKVLVIWSRVVLLYMWSVKWLLTQRSEGGMHWYINLSSYYFLFRNALNRIIKQKNFI